MQKRKILVISALIICAAVAAAVIFGSPEKRTLRYFNAHREALEEDILNFNETGHASSSLDITFNYWDGENPIVEYIVVGRGIVSASHYYGFFYSFSGEPAAFQNVDAELTETSGREWTWNGDGDNRGYVRRLDGNWFYFEAKL